MKLAELLMQLNELDDDDVIYAAGVPTWTSASPAVAVRIADDASVPLERDGMQLLVDVSEARDIVKAWSQWRNGQIPTLADVCEAVIYYARYDAFLPIDDAPGEPREENSSESSGGTSRRHAS